MKSPWMRKIGSPRHSIKKWKYLKSLEALKLDVGGNVEGIGGGSASLGAGFNTNAVEKPDPIKQTFRKLVSIAEKSPRPCVLVIDEANKLMALAGEKPKFFRTFMDGVVKVTKQDRKMHVVFTSSDSFFEKWLTGPNGRCLFLHINELADNLLFSSWA